jgi:hypothetical protein
MELLAVFLRARMEGGLGLSFEQVHIIDLRIASSVPGNLSHRVYAIYLHNATRDVQGCMNGETKSRALLPDVYVHDVLVLGDGHFGGRVQGG